MDSAGGQGLIPTVGVYSNGFFSLSGKGVRKNIELRHVDMVLLRFK